MGEVVHLRRGPLLDSEGNALFRIERRGAEIVIGPPGDQRAIRASSAGRARAIEVLAWKLHELLPHLEVETLLGYVDDACDADHADGPAPQAAEDHLAWAQGWAIAAREIAGKADPRLADAVDHSDAATWAWSIAVRRLLWALLGT